MSGKIDYLLIGHVTADIQTDGSRALGGTVSYAAPIARLFGHQVGLLTSAAACEPLIAPLTEHTQLSVRVADETTTFENIYAPDGIRTQYVHETAAPLTYDDIPIGWTGASMVHLAPLVDEVDPQIVHKFPEATVMMTPQGWMRQWDKDGLVKFKRWFDPDVLSAVDIVVFSRHDVAPAPELIDEFAGVVKCLVVTEGDQGGYYYINGTRYEYKATRVQEVDPTGAGDVFAVSLLASLARVDGHMNAAVEVAARLAALSVTRQNSQQALYPREIDQAINDFRDLDDNDD